MTYRILGNKPLIETILEIRWFADPVNIAEPAIQNVPFIQGTVDSYYQVFFLRAYEHLVKTEYPTYNNLGLNGMPEQISGHTAQHRFASAHGDWPMVQIGPGLLTLNETKNYNWEDFKTRALSLIDLLYKIHPAPEKIRFKQISLKYINAIEFHIKQEDVFEFLSDKLKININFDDKLFENNSIDKRPIHFSTATTFEAQIPKGLFSTSFNQGAANNIPSMIWDMTFQSRENEIDLMPDTFSTWLDGSHKIIDAWFRESIKGELERRFL